MWNAGIILPPTASIAALSGIIALPAESSTSRSEFRCRKTVAGLRLAAASSASETSANSVATVGATAMPVAGSNTSIIWSAEGWAIRFNPSFRTVLNGSGLIVIAPAGGRPEFVFQPVPGYAQQHEQHCLSRVCE